MTLGVSSQAVAVLGCTAVLWTEPKLVALSMFTAFSILENLGTVLSDVVVKRAWAPRLFEGDGLKRTNSRMSQIDLASQTIGPSIAGLMITPWLLPSEVVGFLAVGFLNVLSFIPHLLLLRRIYAARLQQLQPPRPAESAEVHWHVNGLKPQGSAWIAWCKHPSGYQLLSLSYALLYLTVLSPHGALLTAYLVEQHMPSYQLSLLRAAGALLGVLGLALHPPSCALLGHRTADAVFVVALALCTVLALTAFHQADGMTPAMLVFVSCVCLGRTGLYGFELGVLNPEQDLADARQRSAIGSVDTALTSFGTLVMYGSGIVLRSDQFYILVDASTMFVLLGAITYLAWMLFYPSQFHRHGNSSGRCHGHENHRHTLQQEEALVDGWHGHIHFQHPRCAQQ